MTFYERESCISTITKLRNLAINIHGGMDAIDDENCNKLIDLLNGEIDKIYTAHYRQGLKDAKNPPEAIFSPP